MAALAAGLAAGAVGGVPAVKGKAPAPDGVQQPKGKNKAKGAPPKAGSPDDEAEKKDLCRKLNDANVALKRAKAEVKDLRQSGTSPIKRRQFRNARSSRANIWPKVAPAPMAMRASTITKMMP